MTFLLPIGLLTLLLLPLIALLHLIQRRQERVRVPSLQIWRELRRETAQHKPRRIPLTLLLLLHLLLAALLGLALGQPLLQASEDAPSHLAIIIDTSTSMAATDESPDRLSVAKTEARRLIAQLQRGDTAALIDLSAQPRMLARGDGTDTTLFLRELERLRAGGPDGDLATALNLAQASAHGLGTPRIVVLTDVSFAPTPESVAMTHPVTVAGELEWRALGASGDNVAIVAFAARPLRNGQHQLYARVANLGATPIARTLWLDLDGMRVASEPMRLAPGAEAEWSWPLPAGTQRAEASLSGTDLQPLDDRAAVILNGHARARVTLVADRTTALERALRAQRQLVVETVAPADYRAERATDLVVFVNYLPPRLPNAPVLIVAPPRGQTLLELDEALERPTKIVVADERFRGIDFRPVAIERASRAQPPAWASVAIDSSAGPLVLTGHYNDQPIAIWTFDPEASNLPYRLAFPLLTAATTRVLLPQATDQLPLGATAPFAMTHNGASIAPGDRLTQPGIYTVAEDGLIAVNAIDPAESQLAARPAPQIQTRPASVPAHGTETPAGRELWKPLVIAGLIVLLLEWIYINRGRSTRTSRATV